MQGLRLEYVEYKVGWKGIRLAPTLLKSANLKRHLLYAVSKILPDGARVDLLTANISFPDVSKGAAGVLNWRM